jgi:hypothetical protein
MESIAQALSDILVEDSPSLHLAPENKAEPIVFYSEEPSKELVLEMHEPEMHDHAHEVSLEEPHDLEIVVQDLPGVDHLDPEREKELEVSEDNSSTMESSDANNLSKSKPKEKEKDKFDLKHLIQHGTDAVVARIKELLDGVPKHSGYDESGIERCIKYFEKADDGISDAMCADLDGKLDANKIEEIRSKIDDGKGRLYDRYEKIVSKKNKKKKRAEELFGLVKEGQKATRIDGIVITVPLLISRIARVCANGAVSAGKDIEELFARQVKEYDLDKREQAELIQLLEDMGHYFRQDRGFSTDTATVDQRSPENYDWMPNFQV